MKYVYITFVGFLGCGLLTISIYHFGGMKMIWFTIYFFSAIGGIVFITAAVGAIVDLIRRKEKRHGQHDG